MGIAELNITVVQCFPGQHRQLTIELAADEESSRSLENNQQAGTLHAQQQQPH